LKKINTTDSNDKTLPDMKEFYLKKLDYIKEYLCLNDDYYFYDKAKELVKGIKDSMTFVHGDCHFKNIMVQGEDLLLIDMDTLSRGNPIFELAAIRCTYVAFEEDDPGNCMKFLGVDTPLCHKLYDDIVMTYYQRNDKTIYQKIALLSYIHMVWWTLINDKDNKVRLNGCKDRLLHLLNIVDDLNIEV
ncbi:MAG: phosphotransferase, partial [Acholeplasmatales bacterium]|nr:phosphotransferase [Acholeplasmatales bacterium]